MTARRSGASGREPDAGAGRTARQVWIVPGLACRNDGVYDVIRGEETQITGAVARRPGGGRHGLSACPAPIANGSPSGTGAIIAFRTAMTGEVFSVLKDHSILGRLMSAPVVRRRTTPS